MMAMKLGKTEKWGLRLIFLFAAGWLALFAYAKWGLEDPAISLRQGDIKRLLNSELFSDTANIHSSVFIDKVEIAELDSITPSGTKYIEFRYRINSKEDGKSWHEGSVEDKDMEYSNLKY